MESSSVDDQPPLLPDSGYYSPTGDKSDTDEPVFNFERTNDDDAAAAPRSAPSTPDARTERAASLLILDHTLGAVFARRRTRSRSNSDPTLCYTSTFASTSTSTSTSAAATIPVTVATTQRSLSCSYPTSDVWTDESPSGERQRQRQRQRRTLARSPSPMAAGSTFSAPSFKPVAVVHPTPSSARIFLDKQSQSGDNDDDRSINFHEAARLIGSRLRIIGDQLDRDIDAGRLLFPPPMIPRRLTFVERAIASLDVAIEELFVRVVVANLLL